MATQTPTPAAPTVPCPSDQQSPLAPRSGLAALATAAGISADDVRGHLSSRYRCISIVRLFQVSA